MKRSACRSMCNNIGAALHLAGAHTTQILTGPIENTQDAWQLPGLRCRDELAGLTIYEYLDRPTSFKTATFQSWYDSVLRLIAAGGKLNRSGIYPGAYEVFTNVTPEVLRWWFSQPGSDGMAQTIFALEAVECWKRSNKSELVVEDYDNFYVKGYDIGVRDGVVIGWTGAQVSIAGSVDAYLEMPRGAVVNECHYDIIAKVRSATVEHPPEDVLGVESALQALYFIYRDTHCADLVSSMKDSEGTAKTAQAVKFAAKTALDIWNSNLAHTSKVQAISEVLVPTLMSSKKFYTIFGDIEKAPVPTSRRLARIDRYFAELIATKRLETV